MDVPLAPGMASRLDLSRRALLVHSLYALINYPPLLIFLLRTGLIIELLLTCWPGGLERDGGYLLIGWLRRFDSNLLRSGSSIMTAGAWMGV
jgi:hypothetical protein